MTVDAVAVFGLQCPHPFPLLHAEKESGTNRVKGSVNVNVDVNVTKAQSPMGPGKQTRALRAAFVMFTCAELHTHTRSISLESFLNPETQTEGTVTAGLGNLLAQSLIRKKIDGT